VRWTKERPTGPWKLAVALYAEGDYEVRFPHYVEHDRRPVAAWLVIPAPRMRSCSECGCVVLAGEACGVCGGTR